MTIRRKLEIGIGAALALTVAIGIAWLGRLGNLDSERQNAAEKTARRLQIAAGLDSAGSEMLAAMRGIVLFAAAGEPPQAALCKREFDAAAGRWRESMANLRPLLVQDGEKRLVDRMQDRFEAWRSAAVEVERAAARGNSDAALKIATGEGYPLYRANASDTARFRELQDGILNAQRASAASVVRAGWFTDFGALSLAAGAGLLALIFVRYNRRVPEHAPEQAVGSTQAAAPAVEAAVPAVEASGAGKGVNGIAFRTNLLSLNTALEAAPPGTGSHPASGCRR